MRLYANKRDDGERAVIETLEAYGVAVFPVSAAGFPDLLVSWVDRDGGTHTALLEVKAPKGKPTAAQLAFRAKWKDHNYFIVKTPDEALLALGLLG